MTPEEKIEVLGFKLPKVSPPKAMYIPVRQLGNALYVSGQIPMLDGIPVYTGKVGAERTLEEAQQAARLCILNALRVLKDYLGELDKIKNIIKLQAFVNSKKGFQDQHIVINAASQLLYDVLGERGRHARTAVGTNQLPLDVTVEIELVVEI